MSLSLRLLLGALLPLAVLGAQNQADEQSRADMARAQRDLQQNRTEVERLIDMRLRLDLGLQGEDDPTAPRPPGPVTTASKEKLQQEWRDQDAATATLLERYTKLKGMVEQLRTETADRAATQARSDAVVVVPQAGMVQPSQRQAPAEAVETNRVHGAAAAGNAEPRPTTPTIDGLGSLDRPRALIQGSQDHLQVAKALFKAGHALAEAAENARQLNRTEDAKELDKRAKERLQRALDELAPLLAEKEPIFAALFYQGRCRELLFRHAERHEGLTLATALRNFQKREQEVRDPFVVIAARDVTKSGQRGEIEVLGAWGLAAKAAIDHFRWMNEHGSYTPKIPIESITWPGEKDQ